MFPQRFAWTGPRSTNDGANAVSFAARTDRGAPGEHRGGERDMLIGREGIRHDRRCRVRRAHPGPRLAHRRGTPPGQGPVVPAHHARVGRVEFRRLARRPAWNSFQRRSPQSPLSKQSIACVTLIAMQFHPKGLLVAAVSIVLLSFTLQWGLGLVAVASAIAIALEAGLQRRGFGVGISANRFSSFRRRRRLS